MTSGGAATDRSSASVAVPVIAALLVIVLFLALGIWQVERRTWKLALIARVEERVHAAPTPAPGPPAWPRVTAGDAYRRVASSGRFAGPDTLVQAVTDLGPGRWVLTRLDDARGFAVLVNRGFVADASGPVPRPVGATRVTGLLRVSEPGGAFLRRNDPAADRWYSRDVAAIARRRGFARVAPYFIDMDAASPSSPRAPGTPIGGLTVVRFSNSHLIYALTWFTLAGMLAGGTVLFVRRAGT